MQRFSHFCIYYIKVALKKHFQNPLNNEKEEYFIVRHTINSNFE